MPPWHGQRNSPWPSISSQRTGHPRWAQELESTLTLSTISWRSCSVNPSLFCSMKAGRMLSPSLAPSIAPIIPNPKKSPRVIGSFCNSANFLPLLDAPQAQLLPAKPGRRRARLHRVIGLIIYRERHPRVGFHEAHIERQHRRQNPQSEQRGPVASSGAAVTEAPPPPQVGDEC